MSIGRDTIIVGAIVLVTLAWAVRSVWRSVRSGKACSSCAAGDDCPLTRAQNPLDLQDLQNLQDLREIKH